MGRDPLLGRIHLPLGHQNLYFSAIIVIYGSQNFVLLYFVGRLLPNVENHWIRSLKFPAVCTFVSITKKGVLYVHKRV